MSERKTKNILYYGFLLLLLVPLVQKLGPYKDPYKLKGAVETSSKPSLELSSWFSGEFQDKYEKYINDHIGYRPIFVRIHNQVQYSLFNKANARGVIQGKERFLYELNYIKAYNGEDFIGSESIKYKVERLKFLQDTIENLGKTFLICLAPGKGSFYPEYFPEEYIKPQTDTTNYKFYVKYFNEYDINYVDMNKWFAQMKDSCACMLYPKYGIHWSYYGMLMASDSLIRYIEKDRNIKMPKPEIEKIVRTSRLRYSDYDIARGMNLVFQMKSESMCYPIFHWSDDPLITKPKTIVIADSFYWSMFNMGIAKNSFSLGGFWFYNQQIYPDSFQEQTLVKDIDVKERILNSEVIMLISTDANLSKFPWGFTETALGALLNYTIINQ